MSTPKVAVAFPAAAKTTITNKLNDAQAAFPVIASLDNAERARLQVIAEGREPYVADGYTDAAANPDTVPPTVSITDWGLLEEQHAGLLEMESKLIGLLDMVQDTKALAGSQRYETARRYYRYLQGNLDALPAADPIYKRLGRLFAGQGKKAKPAPPA
ncbi:MAG: hypothetical protein HY300_04365 [Verrucomicrobia bacterium]|nr:hypothetical protein [Verrucomicrobiota bacterium]